MLERLARRAHTACHPSTSTRSWSRAKALAAAFVLLGLGLGGCAQQPQQIAAAGHSKEYFPSSVYGRASRRVVEEGQPIPRGGGQYLVGKPYTVAGQTYYPSERRVTQIGLASWYGDAFHGRLTANGEIYDRDSFTAAHPTMPLPSYARVTNLRNNTSMIVRVNDRGPYHSNRIMDVSRRVADALDIRRTGTAKVKVEWVARASLAGSDDAKLAATLRNDGPARADDVEEGLLVATAPARAIVASLGGFAPVPAPARPRRYVEQERLEALESYRAPRAVEARSSRRGEIDGETARSERRTSPHLRHEDAEDDTPETGSLQRRVDRGRDSRAEHKVIAHRDLRRDEDRHGESRRGEQVVRRPSTDSSRTSRPVQHAEAPLPPLRHPVATGRVLPPARPTHLAALVAPGPAHKRMTVSRSRSQGG